MKMHEDGLNRFFGPLESLIMDIVWEYQEVTARRVQELLETDLSYTAVMTVLNRLHEKGNIGKTTSGRGRGKVTCYYALQSKEEFLQEQTRIVTEGLIHEFGDLVVNHMVNALQEADPKLMKLLEERVSEWKRDKSNE
ncbi:MULTISPECIES: BlaI/MecI/CopY family transcriptional regulator [unclassified Paenibacillus]|uniref:BlaI/MecI/CopY family transcriptional regulator n=1 Tax=unclassified Paenibacillus TaxID=185978 RepID=UPI0030184567